MATSSGLKLHHLCILVGVLVVLAAMLLPSFVRAPEEAIRPRCRNMLNQIARGMATYLNEFGDNQFYPWPAGRPGCGTVAEPDFGGAEWLATLYWTRVTPAPGDFNCPSSPHSNECGRLLGLDGCPGGKRLPGEAVSYAAMGDCSVGVYMNAKRRKGVAWLSSKLAVTSDFPRREPMVCDDTDAPINHGEVENGGMVVLFFDSHVEYWTNERVDLEHGVGQGELVHLRN